MKIRILIPQCGEFEGYYCKSATQIDKRINLLRESIKRDFDLLVTSHNFFTFYPNREESVENFIKRELTPKLNELDDKIPIILGFDLLTPNIRFNPFSTGIDALVIALNVKNNKYIYGTHIWECWENRNNCNNKCFENQNPKRVIRIKGR